MKSRKQKQNKKTKYNLKVTGGRVQIVSHSGINRRIHCITTY